jgi:hypothetical protein
MIRNFQFGRLRVRRIVLGPRARTSAAAATSSATRFAGPSFASWGALEAHLTWWMGEAADQPVHGTTGEPPLARLAREEPAALPPEERPSAVRQLRELSHWVQNDACWNWTRTITACGGG